MNDDQKEGPRQWLVFLLFLFIGSMISWMIVAPLYQECRAHGFSKTYCILRR